MPDVNELNKYISVREVKDGDILIFTNAGIISEKDFSQKKDRSDMRKVLDIEVELPTGARKLVSPNKTSRSAIEAKYGSKTEGWVNKAVKVLIVKRDVYGQLKDVIYLEPITE